MKKGFNTIILFFIMIGLSLIVLSSCSKKDNNAKIQLWYYEFSGETQYNYNSKNFEVIIRKAKTFCENNNIPLEIIKYDEKTLSHDDYILKRNIAAASGNMISIDNIRNLYDLAKHHADYTKLDNYENLLDTYKGGFCIPLCIEDRMDRFDNKLLEFYNLSTDKQFITYGEYLDIKQKLKEKGAKFELNHEEILELLDYHLYSNKLLYLNENSEIIDDDIAFKKALKKILLDTCNDIVSHYDSSDFELINENREYRGIKDKISEIVFNEPFIPEKLMDPSKSFGDFNVLNKTYLISHHMNINNLCFFMHKKITNDKIYDLANHIVSEEMYLNINKHFEYLPVFIIKKA